VKKHEPSREESVPHRLPRGRHGLPRELVKENQRARLISGIIEAVAEHGYGNTTIAHITGAAQVSRRTYYETFANKEDCFSAAYEASSDYLTQAVLAAAASQEKWPERVRAGIRALLESLAEHPDLAVFFVISPVGAGDTIADQHHRAMSDLVAELTAGSADGPGGERPTETRCEALAGGISRLIERKVNAGEAEDLVSLLPDLVELVLRPFVGDEEAIRVARRAAA